MKKFFLFSCFILLISAFLTACGNEGKHSIHTAKIINQLTVYTTVYPLTIFHKGIGGDSVVVETIYPPGSDEHTFDLLNRI